MPFLILLLYQNNCGKKTREKHALHLDSPLGKRKRLNLDKRRAICPGKINAQKEKKKSKKAREARAEPRRSMQKNQNKKISPLPRHLDPARFPKNFPMPSTFQTDRDPTTFQLWGRVEGGKGSNTHGLAAMLLLRALLLSL